MTNKRNLPVLTDEEMAEKIRKSIENGERRMSKSSMKMISPGVEVEPDGTTKQILHVLFSDTEGNEVRYRWEELKKVVLEWIEIEESKEASERFIEAHKEALKRLAEEEETENDWDVTPYGEQK